MRFKEWFLKETMTSTNCIASFARPTIPTVRRGEKSDKKKKKEQPQVKESSQS